jgi:hypothetical protein
VSVLSRFRVLFCRHQWTVHLCTPPAGSPYLIVCGKCNLVRWGETTAEQEAVPDTHPSLEASA